ncbi:MAG: hypothetical protein GX786_10920 [Clostridiales bacterium]|nr:hypothetical protein [Clostridiales bacterium]
MKQVIKKIMVLLAVLLLTLAPLAPAEEEEIQPTSLVWRGIPMVFTQCVVEKDREGKDMYAIFLEGVDATVDLSKLQYTWGDFILEPGTADEVQPKEVGLIGAEGMEVKSTMEMKGFVLYFEKNMDKDLLELTLSVTPEEGEEPILFLIKEIVLVPENE